MECHDGTRRQEAMSAWHFKHTYIAVVQVYLDDQP
jgi:hypothetical protein